MSKASIIWIMGLAGAGKTTTAIELAKRLKEKGNDVVYIDGDEFRGVFDTVGYDKAARISLKDRRMRLSLALAKQGFIVINTIIGMFNEVYKYTRKTSLEAGVRYIECYIKCPMSELEKRDQKGLYSGAKAGKIKDVVGVDMAYDEPRAEIVCDGTQKVDKNVEKIIKEVVQTWRDLDNDSQKKYK